MTQEQVDHLNNISSRVVKRLENKYIKGALEHGGNLWEKDTLWLLDQAIEEAIDQYTYLITLRDKIVNNIPDDIPEELSQ